MAKQAKPDDGTSGEGPGIGHNEMTDDERYALTDQHRRKYEAALKAKKEADAQFKNACKSARADLGDDAIADIKDLIAASTPEGEAKLIARMEAEVERLARMARWRDLPVGAAPGMFPEDPQADLAFKNGRRSGLAGDPPKSPYGPGTADEQDWLRGYGEGQGVLASSGFKRLSEPERAGAGNA